MIVNSESWKQAIEEARQYGRDYCWFTEDDPKAFKIILNIVHGKPEANPSHATQKLLLDITWSSRRHGVQSILNDFVHARSSILLEDHHVLGCTAEDIFFIATHFELQAVFVKAATELINNILLQNMNDNHIVAFATSQGTMSGYLGKDVAGKPILLICQSSIC